MIIQTEHLGKVSITVEKDYHNINKCYDKLVIVEEENEFRTYISRKPVPSGVELTDRNYWIPFSSLERQIVIDYNKFKNDVLFASAFHEKLDPTLPEGVAIIKQLFDKDNNLIIPKVSEDAVSDETGKTLKAKLAELTNTLSNTIVTYLNIYFADTIEKAEDIINHPTYIGTDNYVYVWNRITKTYDKTSIYTRGEGFHISKTFDSVADMEAYIGTDLKEGDFVLIQSTPDDPDNAKLYTYSGTQGVYKYLVDMSGALGFTGKTPQFSIGSIIILEPSEQASASLSPDGIDADGNPKYKLNLALPKGAKGTSDFVVVDDHSGAGDDPNKIYIPSAESEKETHDSVMVIPATEINTSAKLKGTTNIVRAAKSVAFGDYNTIGGSASESMVAGRMNLVGASKGIAFGNVNSVNANNGFASGGFNKILRGNSYAEGVGNYVNGQVAHMEGNSVLQITLTGAANTTTYTITETLPSFFIGLPVYYAVSPENNDGVAIFTQALITAIDAENNTITLNGTLSASIALENATARVLCATTQLKSSHVEGSYNFIILNDALTENPLQDSIVYDVFNTEKEDRLQGGHVEGFGNIIAGKYAHAEGVFNIVMNQYAHAEGQENKVLNQRGHAEGAYNEVRGNAGHAEGFKTIVQEAQGHAEGYCTVVDDRSHAEGIHTAALKHQDNYAATNHAEGWGSVCTGQAGHAEGFGTNAYELASHSEGYGKLNVKLTGNEGDVTYSVNVAPDDDWLNSYVGLANISRHYATKIIAIDKVNNTITLEKTLETVPTASSNFFIVHNRALGAASHTEGVSNITEANSSHAEGAYNRATKNSAHAEGWANIAAGEASHAEGRNGRAYGDYSHTEGYANTAFGKAAHAGGDGSLIIELTGAAKATTYSTNVTPHATWVGRYIKKVAEDYYNIRPILITEIDITNNTITVNETLDGTNALSSTPYSVALGGAIADYSFTHGKGVQAGTEAGAVFGKFNVPRNNALFAIGNGTSYTDQHDAFYVDVDGNVYIAGNIINTQMTQLTNKITELENRIATLEGNS